MEFFEKGQLKTPPHGCRFKHSRREYASCKKSVDREPGKRAGNICAICIAMLLKKVEFLVESGRASFVSWPTRNGAPRPENILVSDLGFA
jgi:hypothetical protein